MPPRGSTEWIRPNRVNSAATSRKPQARRRRPSTIAATAEIHSIEVMMKPLPRVKITASSGRPWPSSLVSNCGSWSGAIQPGALIASRYATDGRKPNTIAPVWWRGVAWKAWVVMSMATYTMIGASTASGSHCTSPEMMPSMPPMPTNRPVSSV
ncbi:hypothetical protein G6F63_014598 [Rhizopus arrhizus]|nr:hypothetical protein G6F63_014598 [Rhizopus arrhizus]